jgi:S-DNA-T family DNA segregation ATPase FtsK/SpoIIIE
VPPPAAPAAPAPPPAPEEPKKTEKKEKIVPDAQVQQELALAVDAEAQEYKFPPVDLLKNRAGISGADAGRELQETEELLSDTLQSFGIESNIIEVTRGPSVTRYELELQRGVKLNKLTNLSPDIALSLGAVSVRIAPIPGKNSVVGIEVPNRLVSPVPIRSVIDSQEFESARSQVAFAVGKDISNRNVIGDISRMPHLLIAGTTGSGKSVCTNSMIISLLYKSSPNDVKLIMIDPKMVELSNYNGIPHLLIPVVTDPKKAAGALQWAVNEMMRRYQDFAQLGVREIESYNSIVKANPELGEHKAKIVVFIDELADLMIAAAKEVEEAICRVAQMGRAAGMHLVIATQRPSSDVITGLMKANIPSRIALAVASSLDSRIVLDTSGAENLVGNGDMLFAPLGKPKRRVQGCFISDEEVNAVIDFVKSSNAAAEYSDDVLQQVEENARNNEKGKKGAGPAAAESASEASDGPGDNRDPLYYDAVDVVIETGMASASMLQRRLKLGYSRAARLIDQMEEGGVVGPFEGSKPRKLLLTKEQWAEQKLRISEGTGLDQNLELAKAMSAAADEEQALLRQEDEE